MEQKDKRLFRSAILLLVVHTAGIIGILSSHSHFFLSLTPLSLVLSMSLLLLNHKEYNNAFYTFLIIGFIAGYFIEVLGVKTGIIFGYYTYNDTLGPKLLQAPLVIGINWLMLVYCAGVVSNRINISIFFKSVVGAFMLVILDALIEPVANKFGFWTWTYDIIPAQNYIAWGIVSFALLYLFHSLKFNKDNKLASLLLIIQFLFFMLLRIL